MMRSVLLTLAMGINGTRLGSRDLSGYSSDCRAVIKDIQESSSPNWQVVPSGGNPHLYQKRNCRNSETTYDIVFCTRVCVLDEGDPCTITTLPGYDRCSSDLICSPVEFGEGNTCQSPFDDYNSWTSDSYSDSYGDDWVKIFNRKMEHDIRDWVK